VSRLALEEPVQSPAFQRPISLSPGRRRRL